MYPAEIKNAPQEIIFENQAPPDNTIECTAALKEKTS